MGLGPHTHTWAAGCPDDPGGRPDDPAFGSPDDPGGRPDVRAVQQCTREGRTSGPGSGHPGLGRMIRVGVRMIRASSG